MHSLVWLARKGHEWPKDERTAKRKAYGMQASRTMLILRQILVAAGQPVLATYTSKLHWGLQP
jgi:hypothetical protein